MTSLRTQHSDFVALNILGRLPNPGADRGRATGAEHAALLFNLCPTVTYSFITIYLHFGFKSTPPNPPLLWRKMAKTVSARTW